MDTKEEVRSRTDVAEVIAFDDYIEHQGEAGCKDAGKWRLEGKEYLLQEGDVVHFRFNV